MVEGARAPSPRPRCVFGAAALISGVMVAVTACGGSSSTAVSSSSSYPTVSITATAKGYDVQPATPLPAGTIQFDLANHDLRPHEFKFASPLGATTFDQLRSTLSSGKLDQLPQQIELGFSWDLPPAATQTLYLSYQASTDFVLSLISMGPGSPVDAARGYLAQFTVSGAPATGHTPPGVAGTLSINAHSVSVPSGFGKGTFAMVNNDSTAHQVTFYRFTGPAKPLSEVVATFAAFAQQQGVATGSTPPPLPPGGPPEFALGMQRLGGPDPFPPFGCSCIMNSRVEGAFALSPGTYVVLGDGLNPKTNAFEASDGLAAEFTVS